MKRQLLFLGFISLMGVVYAQHFATVNSNNGNGLIGTLIINQYNRYVPVDYNYLLVVKSRPPFPGPFTAGVANITASQIVTVTHNDNPGDIGEIGHDWTINSNDYYIPFYDSVWRLLLVNPSTNKAMVKDFVYYGHNWDSYWYTRWSNGGSGWIAGWNLSNTDQFYAGDFDSDGKDEILAVKPNGNWAMILKYNDGSGSWSTIWSNGGNDWIGPWNMNSGDKYATNRFIDNGKDQLFTTFNNWAMLLSFNGSTWTANWSNGGNDWIGAWNLSADDKFFSGKFAGDNEANLFPMKLTNWAMKLGFNGSGWTTRWSNNGNGWIGPGGNTGWQIGSSDEFLIWEWGGSNGDELLCIGGSWLMTLKFVPPPPLTVSISGPSSLVYKTTGTFTANPSGGSGTYIDYRWWRKWEGGGWQELITYRGLSTAQVTALATFDIKCDVTDSNGNSASGTKHVNMTGGGGGGDPDGADIVHTNNQLMSMEELPFWENVAEGFYLEQNFPNPFNPSTTLQYSIPKAEFVILKIYDILGKEIQTLVRDYQQPGHYSVAFDASELPSGIYVFTLQAGPFSYSRKMLLSK